jgi:hypothetical protein
LISQHGNCAFNQWRTDSAKRMVVPPFLTTMQFCSRPSLR